MRIIDGDNLIIFCVNYFILLNYFLSNYFTEASTLGTSSTNINHQMNTINSKKPNNILKIPKLSKQSQRLIRQTETEENEGIKKEKPKRYKCFLIEDEEEEQIVEGQQQQNKKQYLSDSAKAALEQRSYFAGFLKDGNENNIMGWEDVGRSENPRRSEGTNAQYLLEKEQQESTKTPIIEYIDDYETSPQKEHHEDVPDFKHVSSGSSYTKETEWETIPAVQAKFSTKDSNRMNEAESVNNQNSVDYSASFEAKQRKQHIDENISDNEKVEEEEGEESEEDLYSDEDVNSITTTKSPQIPKMQKIPQRNASYGGSPRARVFPGLTKLITHTNSLVTTNKPVIQPSKKQIVNTKEQNIAKEYASRENNIALNRNTVDENVNALNKAKQNEKNELVNQNFITHPQQQQKLREVKMPRVILKGAHYYYHQNTAECYAQLYGASPSSVLSFVRNNCAFVKMYLPTASCSEIETLVKSCYERKMFMRKQLIKKRFL
uniref:aECM cysteine-cradle domain-containing protein n=1 Tax=Meloidogyne enterolobii TaxID=390850 RepID=A0A6V7V6D2_MELEN|nr:unnamed protein product [Meloidogyne enterolobii]